MKKQLATLMEYRDQLAYISNRLTAVHKKLVDGGDKAKAEKSLSFYLDQQGILNVPPVVKGPYAKEQTYIRVYRSIANFKVKIQDSKNKIETVVDFGGEPAVIEAPRKKPAHQAFDATHSVFEKDCDDYMEKMFIFQGYQILKKDGVEKILSLFKHIFEY